MLSLADAAQISTFVVPPAKREGIDLTFAEMYDSVRYLASAKESPVVVPLSSFRRAMRGLNVTSDLRGFYDRADAAVLLGWFVSHGEYKSYKAYWESKGKLVYEQYK